MSIIIFSQVTAWCVCVCVWCPQTPSSVFWKELALAMPRRVFFRSDSAGDPQTMLQDDKDPMLTVNPDYLDCRLDTDPAGDLGNAMGNDRLITHVTAIKVNSQKAPSMRMFKT